MSEQKIAESALTKFYPQYRQSQAVDADTIKSIVESLCVYSSKQTEDIPNHIILKKGWTINNIFHGPVVVNIRDNLSHKTVYTDIFYMMNFGVKHGYYSQLVYYYFLSSPMIIMSDNRIYKNGSYLSNGEYIKSPRLNKMKWTKK